MKYPWFLLFFVSFIACDSTSKKKETAYIQTSAQTSITQSELEKSMERGAEIYSDFCKTCHQPNGKGIGSNFPPLAGADYLSKNREESIRGVKFGQKGEIEVNGTTYNGVMAPMGLANDEVADVMNYIMNSWDNAQETMVTEEEVARIKKK